MALNLITAPTPSAPSGLADYVAQNNLLEAGFLNINSPLQVISGNIPESAVFQIGGAIYRADSDTAISGVASDYVKITPSGATASAAYVANLTGVSWNSDYNGYYDVSGNLYIFHEGLALVAGEISTVFGRYAMQLANGDTPVIGNGKALLPKVIDIGDWNMDSTQSVDIAHGISDHTKIRAVSAVIRKDDETDHYVLGGIKLSTLPEEASTAWISYYDSTNVGLYRTTGGFFDSAVFDATSFNRGWITIWYEV